jgi:hypothetical protein
MDDYISRQAAINIVCDGECDDCPDGGCELYRRIKKIKATDALKVVRCRDCIYYKESELLGPTKFCYYYKIGTGLNTADDDYCSHGERRKPNLDTTKGEA